MWPLLWRVECQPPCKGGAAHALPLRWGAGDGRPVTRPWETAAGSPAAQPSAQQQPQPPGKCDEPAWKRRPPQSGLQMRQPPQYPRPPPHPESPAMSSRQQGPRDETVLRGSVWAATRVTDNGQRTPGEHSRRRERARPSRPDPQIWRPGPAPPQLPPPVLSRRRPARLLPVALAGLGRGRHCHVTVRTLRWGMSCCALSTGQRGHTAVTSEHSLAHRGTLHLLTPCKGHMESGDF